jgi:hypothetical protein
LPSFASVQKAHFRGESMNAPIGIYSGVPMTATTIGLLPNGSPHVVWGEEIPAPRDLTHAEFFQLVMREAKLTAWPESLTLRVCGFCSIRDSAMLMRTDGQPLAGDIPKKKGSGWATWIRSFCRRYLHGMTLESAKWQPLSTEQVEESIRDAVRKIAAAVVKEIRTTDEH